MGITGVDDEAIALAASWLHPVPTPGATAFAIEVGRRVRQQREALRISQKALGAAVGMTQSSVWRVEHGQLQAVAPLAYIAQGLIWLWPEGCPA